MKQIKYWNINKNGLWLKTVFKFDKKIKRYFTYVVCSKSKRKINDCISKTDRSPKNFYNKKTGGIKSNNMDIFKNILVNFNKKVRVSPASKRLAIKYQFLLNLGFRYDTNNINKYGYYEN